MEDKIPRNAGMSDFVYDELVRRFTHGAYKLGDKLPTEMSLSSEFHVSRPIIRQALAQLREDGYVESRKGSGSYLVRLIEPAVPFQADIKNRQGLIECYEYRIELEIGIAYYAAIKATELDRANIDRAYRESRGLFSMGSAEQMQSDFAFHLAIAQASHNPFFVQALSSLRDIFLAEVAQMPIIEQATGRAATSIKDEEHSRILSAILSGDALYARSAMFCHLKTALQRLIDLMD